MSKDTERLNKMVQGAFFSLHQKLEITHGVVMNLLQAPGLSNVVFPIYGASGGVSLQLVFYLTAEHPTKGFAFTNGVGITYDDTYEAVDERMAREMARLQGFVVGRLYEEPQQPRITNLDAGELGIPWKLGGQGAQEIVKSEPHVGTYAGIRRSEVPLLRTRSDPGVFDRKTFDAGRALIGEAWQRKDRGNPVPIPDRERGLPDPRQNARTASQVADGTDCEVPFQIKPAPTCECGAKEGESHFQFCPMWQDLLEVTDATQAE